MSRLVIFVLAAVLAGMASPAGAAPVIAPSAASDELLKLRAEAEGELRFTFRRERPGRPSDTISIGLARDYDHVDSNGSRVIHDYRLRRVLTTRPDRRFIDNSLFAEAWFRSAELENRARFMRPASQAAGIDKAKAPSAFDPFWIETEIGMVHPSLPRPTLAMKQGNSASTWLLEKKEVASVRFGTDPVPGEVKPGLRRLWATLVKLHPAIVDELAAAGRLPAELRVKVVAKDQTTFETWRWTLTGMNWVPSAPYPLPTGLAAAPADPNGAFPEIFATLADAVAQRRVPPAESVYVQHAEAAIARSAGLEGLLWLLETQLAAGPANSSCGPGDASAYCQLMPRITPLAKADRRTAIAFGKAVPGAADRRQLDDLPNAYLLGVPFATRPHGPDYGPAEAERGLLAGLRASHVANFCKDTGDFYLARWNPTAAWQAWDFGRLMAGHRSGDLLDGVDAIEAELTRHAPMFF